MSLCKVVISFTTNPSSLCYDAEVRLFCFSSLDSSSLSLSLISGLFLLSPAMMAPHLAVGTMRNDKMGEPCFYLMGQNQTTVCSQVCPSSPSPLKNFLSILSTPSAHPHLNSYILHLPLGLPSFSVHASCVVMPEPKIRTTFVKPLYDVHQTNNSDWSKLIMCCCFSNLSRLPAPKHAFYFFYLFFFFALLQVTPAKHSPLCCSCCCF